MVGEDGIKKILLVDDEPLILMDLEFAAEDAGLSCLAATNVETALQMIERDRPDCAVLDVSLTGNDTCVPIARELDLRGIPYIIHSGDLDRQNERIRSLDAPRVAKPCNSDTVIRKALDHASGTASQTDDSAEAAE
ncbi:response regulator [Erythrobacter litoralis]|uniref:response regulator n=1 Tax=Erythrobacter litoralis TaxID=39960 RepID=UPI002434D539|nr:response regulator [Erythrobacter litoralis]MDG6078916.1 response regulator [Erythrobacter litoralis]